MDCHSPTTPSLTRLASTAPAVTVSSCAWKRRTPSSACRRQKSFLRTFMPSKSRRCRIKVTAQVRIALLGLVAGCIVMGTGCRQDMQNQPKFIPLRSSEFYPDHRSARDPIMGTVPWSKEPLNENTYFFTGKQGTGFGNDLPAPLKLD